MPSKSKEQHNFMAAVANNASFAKKAGVPKSVGEDFMQADKGIKFKGGQQSRPDLQKVNNPKTNHGKLTLFKKGGDTMASKMNSKMMAMAAKRKPMMPVGGRMGMDNQMMQAGTAQPGTPAMMKKGGMAMKKMAMGGMAKDDKAQDKKMIKKAVGMHDKQQHGGKKTSLTTLKKGGMMHKMAGGGLAAGHKAADGVATKGKTKGTMIKMSKGGRYC
jgi:hypothetical protein